MKMGGTTIIENGKTIKAVLQKIKEGIITAFPNLQPDSDVALYNPTVKEGKIFKAKIKRGEDGYSIEDVAFLEVEKGNIGMPVAVASIYGKKPKKDEWQGSIHLHT